MADHCVQRDFFWRLSFKGGTDCDRAQLLGQDLIKDLEASEGICQQLRTHAESMKTGNMTKAFRFLVEEISDIRKSVSKEQWELQKICRKMGWPSGTTKIAEDKGHAIIEEEALPRFREYLQDSRKEPILKHHVVVSPAYLPLLEKLMAERLTGERQPKLSPPTRNELPLGAKRFFLGRGIRAHHGLNPLMLSRFLAGPPKHSVVQPSCHVKLESKAVRWLPEPRREGRHLEAA